MDGPVGVCEPHEPVAIFSLYAHGLGEYGRFKALIMFSEESMSSKVKAPVPRLEHLYAFWFNCRTHILNTGDIVIPSVQMRK